MESLIKLYIITSPSPPSPPPPTYEMFKFVRCETRPFGSDRRSIFWASSEWTPAHAPSVWLFSALSTFKPDKKVEGIVSEGLGFWKTKNKLKSNKNSCNVVQIALVQNTFHVDSIGSWNPGGILSESLENAGGPFSVQGEIGGTKEET